MVTSTFAIDARFGRAIICDVVLNGVVVTRKTSGDPESHSLPIQHEVVPGLNRLEFRITSRAALAVHPTPVQIPQPDGFYLEVELEEEEAEDLGDRYRMTTYEIDELEWRPEGPFELPHRETLEFEAAPGTSRPAWMDAQPVDPGMIRSEVDAALRALHAALSERDFERYAQLTLVRDRDMAQAYPLMGNSAARAQKNSAILSDLLTPDAFPVPLGEELEISTEADGRLIRVVSRMGKAPLRIITPDEPEGVELPVGFAMLGGALAVIR
ncbi:MAG: hypothetical protein V2I43_03220 [Parvularcula sp.]|jgi:hypothetical protein|nr:hypothetical protein [Parvularcula sp.]